MKRYSHILHDLNGGESCIRSFIRKHSIFNHRENPMACLTYIPLKPCSSRSSGLNLDPMQDYVDRLLGQLDGQTRITDRVFPSSSKAMILFTKRVLDNILMDYATFLIDRTRQGSEAEVYLKTVVGTYHQCRRLVRYLNKPKDATTEFRNTLSGHIDTIYTPHIEPYLRVELDHYKKCCDSVVDSWKQKVSPSNK